MNKFIKFCFVSVLALFISACDDFTITDYAPVNIGIQIVDEKGNNLLNPEIPGNWFGQEFEVVYNGESYKAYWPGTATQPESRYYLPTFRGLTLEPHLLYDTPIETLYPKFYFSFGEFDGAEDQDISLKFFVPGQSEPYDIRLVKKKSTNITINGKKHKGSVVKIVLPHLTDTVE